MADETPEYAVLLERGSIRELIEERETTNAKLGVRNENSYQKQNIEVYNHDDPRDLVDLLEEQNEYTLSEGIAKNLAAVGVYFLIPIGIYLWLGLAAGVIALGIGLWLHGLAAEKHAEERFQSIEDKLLGGGL